MQIEFDIDKRNKTLAERGLGFTWAAEVFAGPTLDQSDSRFEYGEPRNVTFGLIDERVVVVVWTPRGDARLFR